MKIQVKLFGTLRPLLPPEAQGGVYRMHVSTGTTPAAVLAALGVTIEHPDHLVILVNGRQARPDKILQPNDVLSAFPAVAGGCSDKDLI